MKYSVKSMVKELIENQIITDETGDAIKTYFQSKKTHDSESRLLGIFGVIGAVLTGIGLILIVAHNWDMLSRSLQSFLSIVPVVAGVLGCWYAISKKSDSFAWTEGAAVFLTFAFGACIALISQIYNIPGSLKGYMLTWIVAILPLIYIMHSKITSLLLLAGLVSYGIMAGYIEAETTFDQYGHWLFLALLLPFYIYLLNKERQQNTTYFHHWFIPITIAILLGTLESDNNPWLLPAYFSVFGLFYLGSRMSRFKNLPFFANGYRIVGSLGMIIMLLVWSFREPWSDIFNDQFSIVQSILSFSAVFTIASSAIGLFLIYDKWKNGELSIMYFALIIFPLLFILGANSSEYAVIGINIFLLAIGASTIQKGSSANHLGLINYGLLIITALIICRFFDTNIPFFVRGLIFIGVGLAFFLFNYRIISNRKNADS